MINYTKIFEDLDKQLIISALAVNFGNVTAASEMLNVDRGGLLRRIGKYKIDKSKYEVTGFSCSKQKGKQPLSLVPDVVPNVTGLPKRYMKSGSLLEDKFDTIKQALIRHNGCRTHAAKELGISLRCLRYTINDMIVLGHDVIRTKGRVPKNGWRGQNGT